MSSKINVHVDFGALYELPYRNMGHMQSYYDHHLVIARRLQGHLCGLHQIACIL